MKAKETLLRQPSQTAQSRISNKVYSEPFISILFKVHWAHYVSRSSLRDQAILLLCFVLQLNSKYVFSQVSFDDEDTSIGASYHLEDSSTSVTESDVSKAKRPKRGARVSKAAQQSRKNSSKNRDADSSTVHAVTFSIAEPLANSPQKLDSITGQTLSQSQFQTPATNRKRKLFTLTPRADVSYMLCTY